MPLLQGPRRAAPPRKKVTPKSTLAEVAPESLREDTSDVASEGLPLPIPVPSYVETEVVAADSIADTFPSEPASGGPTEESGGPAPIVLSPEEITEASPPPAQLLSDASDPRSESLEESQADSTTVHDLLRTADPIELDVPSELRDPRDESEFEEATRHEPSKGRVPITEEVEDDAHAYDVEDGDEDGHGYEGEITREQGIPERVSEAGGFSPSGGQPVPSPFDKTTTLHAERKLSADLLPEETGDSTFEIQPLQLGASPISHSVSQQGGSANAVDDEDGGDNGKY